MLYKYEDLLFSTDTGEILETHSDTYKPKKVKYPLPFDFSSVANREQAEKMFNKDNYNPEIRIRWTNWAVEVLTSVDPTSARMFSALSKLLISRNFIFDTNKNIADAMDCSPKHLSANLRKMQSCGLIRISKDHSGGQNQKLIQVNPTLVFKTYISHEGEPQGKFGHNKVFNNLHADYINRWLQEGIKKSSYMY